MKIVKVHVFFLRFVLLLIIFIGLFVSMTEAQQTHHAPAVVASDFLGAVENGNYTNRFFGFALKVPEGFTVLDRAQVDLLDAAGADVIKNGDEQARKNVDQALLKQATIFAMSQKAVGNAQNAAIEIVVLKQADGVTANMALAASVGLMTSGGRMKLVKTLSNAVFGGKQFSGAQLETDLNGVHLVQQLFVIIRRKYSVHFGISYTTDDGRVSMEHVLQSIVFTN